MTQWMKWVKSRLQTNQPIFICSHCQWASPTDEPYMTFVKDTGRYTMGCQIGDFFRHLARHDLTENERLFKLNVYNRLAVELGFVGAQVVK